MRTRKSGKIIEFKEEKDLHFEAKAKTQRLSMSVLMILLGGKIYMIERERKGRSEKEQIGRAHV